MADAGRELPRELADHVDDDVASVLDTVREQAVRRVRDRLVDAYVAALEQRLHGAPHAGRPQSTPQPAQPVRRVTQSATSDAVEPGRQAGGTGCYVYAVVPGDGTGAGTGSPGVQPERPVELIAADDLSAVVSTVSLDAMRALMSDDTVTEDGPLARAVRAHDAVVDTAFRAGPVVPLRFGTVLPDRDAVARLIGHHAAALRDELEHLSAGREWGVKLFAEASGADVVDEEPPVDTGRDYLLAKSRRRTAAAQAAERRASAVAAIHESLAAFAADAVLPKATAGGDHSLLLNASYLVRSDDEPRFLEVLDSLSRSLPDRGFRVERTGPWPPYHFVRLDLSGATS